ncbi:MAG: M48 family metallopeptidase [Pseudohongiella sp.]|nr:M48 family metallopeptidase [Pseudohongiella sp.]MDP2125744.1 M48 family metallopeptidase [Pseudohongiella sp.]
MKRFRTTALAAVSLSLLVSACATSPTGRSQILLVSDAQVAAMGEEAFAQLKQENTVSRDQSLTRYVNCVSSAILAGAGGGQNWEVVLFDDASVNAFALPGGKIGIFTGLLNVAENQHQLATVVGHEIAHVTARHSAARVSNQLATQMGVSVLAQTTGMDPALISMGADLLLNLPYSRADETESDLLGLDYMAQAGFDPRQSVALWQNMERASGGGPPQFLSTHPAPQARIRDLERRMPAVIAMYDAAQAQGRRPECQP